MLDNSSKQFGLLVSVVLPGFVALAGIIPLFPVVGEWLRPVNRGGDQGFGPPIYALMAATTMGMIVGCVRWLVVDNLLSWSGVTAPEWNDRLLDERLDAFNYIVEVHYRYYQFYSNTLVALAWSYLINRSLNAFPPLGIGTDLGALILCLVLLAGSRDALVKYYTRTRRLIGEVAEKGEAMTNGNHHEQESGGVTQTRPGAKAAEKPNPAAKKPEPRSNKEEKPSK